MGMFTSVFHPKTGAEIQIRSGDDQCDQYRVGDEVDWFVSPQYVGGYRLLDGVYGNGGIECERGSYVVIKEHRVHAVMDADNANVVRERFGMEDADPYQPEFYTAEAWATNREREERFAGERAEFAASVAHISTTERLRAYLSWPLGTTMHYQNMARHILAERVD